MNQRFKLGFKRCQTFWQGSRAMSCARQKVGYNFKMENHQNRLRRGRVRQKPDRRPSVLV